MLSNDLRAPNLMVPSLFSSGRQWGNTFSMPHSNIEQTDTAVNVELAVPGFDADEVMVNIDGNLLKIQAQHKDDRSSEQKDERGNITGRSKFHSSNEVFESFRLPSGLNLNGMTKNVSNGMLQLSIPKMAILDKQNNEQKQQLQKGATEEQQQQWPPEIHTNESDDKRTITYTIPLKGDIRKEDIRMNIENSTLYLTVLEHGEGHAFNSCDTCTSATANPTNYDQQQSWSYRKEDQQRLKEARKESINNQCNRFSERSCVIRLPYGTTSDGVDAKFLNGQLTLTVEKDQANRSRGSVNIN